MSIKVLSAKFKNYGRLTELKCRFFDGVTRLVGMNGSGKSTILDGLISCIKGIAKNKGGIVGDRYRFIGSSGKSADIEYEFIDENTAQTFFIKNHITSASNKITIRCTDDTPIGEEWLKSFLNISLMSATAFSQLSGKEQAELLGIDVSSFDNELQELKKQATGINATIKAFGDIKEVESVEKIDIKQLQEDEKRIESELNQQYIKNRDENNKRREEHRKLETNVKEIIKKWHDETHNRVEKKCFVEDALKRLRDSGYVGNEVQQFIDTLPEPDPEPHTILPELILVEPEMPDSTELHKIRNQINEAWENNAKYQEYKQYLEQIKAMDNLVKSLNKNKEAQKQCIEERNNYLSSHDYGFKGLSVDENGELVLSVRGEDSRPLKQPYFSRGEMELIVAKLHIAMNPEFKVRFIDDFEAIDDENQEKILSSLLESGFQVIVAEVGKQSDKENCIVITEGKIQNDETDERPEIL